MRKNLKGYAWLFIIMAFGTQVFTVLTDNSLLQMAISALGIILSIAAMVAL